MFQENIEKQECTPAAGKGPTPRGFKNLMGFQLSCTRSSAGRSSAETTDCAGRSARCGCVHGCEAEEWVFFFPFWLASGTHKLKKQIKLPCILKALKHVKPYQSAPYLMGYMCSPQPALNQYLSTDG